MRKKILMILFLLFVLISTSAVCAADFDVNNDTIASSDDAEALTIENDIDTIDMLNENDAKPVSASNDNILENKENDLLTADNNDELLGKENIDPDAISVTVMPKIINPNQQFRIYVETASFLKQKPTGECAVIIDGTTYSGSFSGGKVNFNINNGVKDTTTAKFKWEGDDNYNPYEMSFAIEVVGGKKVVNPTITQDPNPANPNSKITINVNNFGDANPLPTGVVYLTTNDGGKSEDKISGNSFKIVIPITDKTSTATLTWNGDVNYNSYVKTFDINVTSPTPAKKDIDPSGLDFRIPSEIYPDQYFTITVGVASFIDPEPTGMCSLIIDNTTYTGSFSSHSVMFDGIKVKQTTTAKFKWEGDDNYNPYEKSIDINVVGGKKDVNPTITQNPNPAEPKSNVTINVDNFGDANPAPTGEVYLVSADGAIYVTKLDGNSFKIDIQLLEETKFTLSWKGDENYNSYEKSIDINVTAPKKDVNPTITQNPNPAEPKSKVTINVDNFGDTNPAPTGVVYLTVDGETYEIKLDGNSFKIDIKSLEKTSIATLNWDGDENYNPYEQSFSIKVNGSQIKPEIETTITEDIKVYDKNVTIDVVLPKDATGLVMLAIDGELVNQMGYKLINGSASISVPFDLLTPGRHSYLVTYDGDDTYLDTFDYASFNVEAIPSKFDNVTVESDLNITAILIDDMGDGIANATITYTIGNVTNSTITGANGEFTIPGVAGETITIDYAGDDVNLPTSLTITLSDLVPELVESHFNIPGGVITINAYAVDTKAGEKGISYATELFDANGNPIAGVRIQFALNNKIYNRTTNENGSFTPYHLDMVRAGRYTMAFYFSGNENYASAFASVCVDLAKKPINIKASAKTYKASAKTKSYTVSLSTEPCSSSDGKAHLNSGKKVSLTVNGKTYSGKTNDKGQVTFKLTNLSKKGKYTAKIGFAGDNTYEAATTSVKITIN